MKKKFDSYTIEGSVVVCRSASGKTYNLTKDTCSCVGFGFHRSCRHHKEASAKGLFNKIEKAIAKGAINFRSLFIIEQRKKAIKAFLEKNKIKFNQAKIDRLEPMVTITMKPKEFLALAVK